MTGARFMHLEHSSNLENNCTQMCNSNVFYSLYFLYDASLYKTIVSYVAIFLFVKVFGGKMVLLFIFFLLLHILVAVFCLQFIFLFIPLDSVCHRLAMRRGYI